MVDANVGEEVLRDLPGVGVGDAVEDAAAVLLRSTAGRAEVDCGCTWRVSMIALRSGRRIEGAYQSCWRLVWTQLRRLRTQRGRGGRDV